jgi:hypothetical protein
MSRARSPIVLLILLLAAGPPVEAICGAWCGDGLMSAACHDVAPAAAARLEAAHACEAPVLVAWLPQPQGERTVHRIPCDMPPAIDVCPRGSGHDQLRLDVRLVPFDRQPLSPNLRI